MKTKETYLDQNILYICNRVKYNKQNNIKYDYDLDFFAYKMYRIYESEYKLKEINMLYQIYKPNFNLGRAFILQICFCFLMKIIYFKKK